MFISELYLRAFGRFEGKKINLNNKLNIICGENEAGKSTIHNFIEAMLYGYENDKIGSMLYKKYKPWNSSTYKGAMNLVTDEDIVYTINKDFLLNNTEIYGTDADGMKGDSKEVKGNYPGEVFFAMNKSSYRNTVSIKQLGNKTDAQLADEVKNKIKNLSQSKDETISVENILNYLKGIKEEAGSESNPKTLLGQYHLRLLELRTTRENVIKSNRQTRFLAREKKLNRNRIDQIETEIVELNKESDQYELWVLNNKYTKAKPIQKDLDEIMDKLSGYVGAKEASAKDYDEAQKLVSTLNRMNEDYSKLECSEKEYEGNLNKLVSDVSNNIPAGFDIHKLNENYRAYQDAKQKIKELNSKINGGIDSINSYNMDEIKKCIKISGDAEINDQKIKILKILVKDTNREILKNFEKHQNIKKIIFLLLGTALGAVGGGSIFAGYYYSVPVCYVGAVSFVFTVIFYMISKKSSQKSKSVKSEIESIDCAQTNYEQSIENFKKENDEIFSQKGLSTIEELMELHEEKQNIITLIGEKNKLVMYDKEKLRNMQETYQDLEKQLLKDLEEVSLYGINEENIDRANEIYRRKDKIKTEIAEINSTIENSKQNLLRIEKEILFEEKRLKIILMANNIADMNEFDKIIKDNEIISELKSRKNNCEILLENILDGSSYEDIKEKAKNIAVSDYMGFDKQQQLIKIFAKNEEKNNLLKSIQDKSSEIMEIEHIARRLVEVEEEIEFYEDKIKNFKERIQIADIAMEKIIEISDYIKGDFMPVLRKAISENFAYVIGSKYKEVIIDDDMNISLLSEEKRDGYVNIESLSGGTLDQLYLSLRISLSNLLSTNRYVPIILDDSFVQYDTGRLRKSLEMLNRESKRRQIILFTCQEREVEVAKDMNLDFNLINL